MPKTIAVSRSERIALLFALPLKGIEWLLWPLVVVLQRISRLFLPAGGLQAQARSITEAELRTLIDIGESEGAFEPAEAELLENVFRFGDRQVREVMTPRNEIVFIQRGASLAEFLDVPTSKTLKAVFYSGDGELAFVTIRGDLDVNEVKLRNSLGVNELRLATPAEVAANSRTVRVTVTSSVRSK